MTEKQERPDGERIAKYLARAGICSRREAERLIEAKRVEVEGAIITTPATFVTASMKIKVDGEMVAQPEQPRVWLFHKPKGIITSHKDPEGRKTVFELLPPELPRVISVGRLDYNTEGLLLLTNSGEISRYLELPATGWIRHYRVRVFGNVQQKKLEELKEGVTVEGVTYGKIEVSVERKQGGNSWLSVKLKEGKNREIRKVMEHCGLQVNRLIRISYGSFQLGRLPEGKVKEVSSKVVKEQLGSTFS